jgi:hypothetical protein
MAFLTSQLGHPLFPTPDGSFHGSGRANSCLNCALLKAEFCGILGRKDTTEGQKSLSRPRKAARLRPPVGQPVILNSTGPSHIEKGEYARHGGRNFGLC